MPPLRREDLSAHCPRMYRVALRIVGSHHSAEEIVQEVCVRVLEKGDELLLQPGVQAGTYLYRATVNCAVDRLRRENVEVAVRRKLEEGHFPEGLVSPDRIAERKELFNLATSLVATLPDDCRMAFILTQLDGYTYDEAAQIEAAPRGTIATRVARARSLLQAALNDASVGSYKAKREVEAPAMPTSLEKRV